MTIYQVKNGEHDFKPNNQPLITMCSKCDWEFELDPSMYFRRTDPDYPYGKYDGWNKLGMGFTNFFSVNDRRSAMLGWFPYEDMDNYWTIVGYTNDRKKKWDAQELLIVDQGRYEGQTILLSDIVVFKIRKQGSFESHKYLQMDFDDWFVHVYRGIGGNYGGQYPAFKDMKYSAKIEYY